MSATAPPSAHTRRIRTGSPTTRATFDGLAKIPTPTIPPATTTTESSSPSSRRKPGSDTLGSDPLGSDTLLRRARDRRRHLRRGQARQHLVAHGELIQRRRDRDRRRLHIVLDDALVVVEVRVVRVRVVLDRILAEANARQPGVVERG